MARHRWWVIATWLVALVALAVPAATLHDVYRDVFTVPGTNSQESTNLLEQRFPSQQEPTASIVFAAKPGATLTGAADKAAIAAVLAAVQKQTGVASVTNPFGQLPRVSGNGRIAVATVNYTGTFATVPKGAFVALETAGAPARAAGLEVQYGGPVVDIQNQNSNDGCFD